MDEHGKPNIEYDQRGSITVATVTGTEMLDGLNVNSFGDDMVAYANAHPGAHVLLNFENITYMSSAALTELLRVNQTLRSTKGDIRLCGLTDEIRRVFEITNLEKLFVVQKNDSVDSALKRYERALEVAKDERAWTDADTGA